MDTVGDYSPAKVECLTKSFPDPVLIPIPPTLINATPPPPPPPPPNDDNDHLHPISAALRKNELGKAMLTLTVTVAVPLLLFTKGSSWEKKLKGADLVAVGLMGGVVFIWNGILLRTTWDSLANVAELIGIGLVWISVFGLVASCLPILSSSIFMWICGGLCLLPLLLSLSSSLKSLQSAFKRLF